MVIWPLPDRVGFHSKSIDNADFLYITIVIGDAVESGADEWVARTQRVRLDMAIRRSEPQVSFRNVVFWAGALATVVWSSVIYVWFGVDSGTYVMWWPTVPAVGTVLAYLMAWTILRRWPYRILSIFFFLVYSFLTFYPGILMLYLPGLLGLGFGTPSRPSPQTGIA